MITFGLIGKTLKHSFSQKYFTQKFRNEALFNYQYKNFELENIQLIPNLLAQNPDLAGFNVTIPYKQQIFDYLNVIDHTAQKIGAVNTVKVIRTKHETLLHGYNTDSFGFSLPLTAVIHKKQNYKALILGTGGASLAVQFACTELGITYKLVSRKPTENCLSYHQITAEIINRHQIIINTTPLGMFPNSQEAPPLPYHAVNEKHILYDLVYNPQETLFLKYGKQAGATTINGLDMLHLQAEKAWEIFRQ